MNHRSQNSKSLYTSTRPESFYKDEWVRSRKLLRSGGITIEHLIMPADELEVETTQHHMLGYLLSKSIPRQVTRIDGEEYDGAAKKGYAFLKPAMCDGFWHWEVTDETLLFAIEPAFLRKVATQNNCSHPEKIEVLPMVEGGDRRLDNLAEMFLYEMNHAEFGNSMYIESLVDMLMIHLLRNYCTLSGKIEENSAGLTAHQLKQVKEYINEYLDCPLKVEEIAELVDLSQYHFARQFKRSTGMSPHEYVTQQRIIKVKHLLKNPLLPIKDIAHYCGFTHSSHMGRVFKEHLGITPRKYRNEMTG